MALRPPLLAALICLVLLVVPAGAEPVPNCAIATPAPILMEGVDQFVVVGQPQPCPPPNRARADFVVTTDFGDGVTKETPFQDPDQFELWFVGGSHAYRRAGTYQLVGTMTDRQTGEQQVLRKSIEVPNAPLTARPSRATFVARHKGLRTVARFGDGNRLAEAADHTAQISWGDGSRSSGSVVLRGGDFVVLGSHRYRTAGPRTITVVARDDRGAVLRLRTPARVRP